MARYPKESEFSEHKEDKFPQFYKSHGYQYMLYIIEYILSSFFVVIGDTTPPTFAAYVLDQHQVRIKI